MSSQPPPRSVHWAAALQRAWLRRGWIARALRPASLLYGLVWRLRAWAYRRGYLTQARVSVPVVVVGNVVVGGAGKTPVTMALVAHLHQRGVPAGIVSRGHGGRRNSHSDATQSVQPESDPRRVGDEPLLMRRATGAPVVVGRNRAAAARALLREHPEVRVIVCDDGLQHLALARDIEICVFDERGFGNGWLLPSGPLREPWPRPVDLLLHTGSLPAMTPAFITSRRLAPRAVRADGTTVELQSLRGKRLHAVAGIARPEAFFDMLRAAGLVLDRTTPLPDHYHFDSWICTPDVREQLICTEKDAVKLWPLQPEALAVPLQVALPSAFFAAFDRLLDARLSSAADPFPAPRPSHGRETA